jgi:hypothetical protein
LAKSLKPNELTDQFFDFLPSFGRRTHRTRRSRTRRVSWK